MPVPPEVAQLVRNHQARLDNQLGVLAQGLGSMFNSAKEIAQSMKLLAEYGKGFEPLEWEMLARQADRVIPFWYTAEVVFGSADATMRQGSFPITQEGYFLATRMSCAFRPTTGVNNGRFRPISAGNPIIAGNEAVAGANVADQVNFTFQYVEGAAQRSRMSGALPGEHFYRQDGDLVFPIPDIWMPSSTVTVFVTPTVAVTLAGIFSVTVWGMQCLSVLAAGA